MRGSRFGRFVAIAVGSLLVAAMTPVIPAAHAGSLPFAVDEDVVYASGGADSERFGDAVALQGDTMVVGVPMHAVGALAEAGIVYVYRQSGANWEYVATLQPPVQAAGDGFGTSVAISGDRIVVGSPGYDVGGIDSGGAFVFTRTDTGWSAAVTLPADSAIAGDLVGRSVDIDGDVVVIGCPGAESGRGQVRTLGWDGAAWVAGQVLQDPAGAAADRLGECVSISAVTILASASGDDVGAVADAGSVAAFTTGESGWSYFSKITAPTPVAAEGFGGAIDVGAFGYVAVVGSRGHDDGSAVDAGRAYVYERDATGWTLVTEFANPAVTAAPAGDRFGSAVTYDGGDLILVGAPGTDTGADDNDGAAYYFQLRGGAWTKVQDVTPPEDPCCWEFGAAVALDDGTAAIGAPLASSA